MGDVARHADVDEPARDRVRGGRSSSTASAAATRCCTRRRSRSPASCSRSAAVYLAGYFDLTDKAALAYWLKGLGTWTIHFLYLILGVAHHGAARPAALHAGDLRRSRPGWSSTASTGSSSSGSRSPRASTSTSWWSGRSPPARAASAASTSTAPSPGSQNVYRINALTGDPNHLGVMLCVPLMLLLPYYLGDRRGRRRIGLLLLFMFIVQVLTLSRSAALGDAAGMLVLLPVLRRYLPQRPHASASCVGGLAVAFGVAVRVVALRPRGHRRPHPAARQQHPDPPPVLPAGAARARPAPAVRDGVQHLRRLLPVRHRQDRLRPAQRLDRDPGRDGDGRAWPLYLVYFAYLVRERGRDLAVGRPRHLPARATGSGGVRGHRRRQTCST